MFLSCLRERGLIRANLTYDIICQWKINLKKRLEGFSTTLTDFVSKMKLEFGIPKFHLPAHGPKCWSLFSLNFLRWWGRVDGEAIERVWAAINGVATSTREMGPGARHDYLDDQWGASNFRKYVKLGR